MHSIFPGHHEGLGEMAPLMRLVACSEDELELQQSFKSLADSVQCEQTCIAALVRANSRYSLTSLFPVSGLFGIMKTCDVVNLGYLKLPSFSRHRIKDFLFSLSHRWKNAKASWSSAFTSTSFTPPVYRYLREDLFWLFFFYFNSLLAPHSYEPTLSLNFRRS